MITTRGCMWKSEKRSNSNSSSEARPWRVLQDPSEMFLNGTFRGTDLSAGGFDETTSTLVERAEKFAQQLVKGFCF